MKYLLKFCKDDQELISHPMELDEVNPVMDKEIDNYDHIDFYGPVDGYDLFQFIQTYNSEVWRTLRTWDKK